jgi:polyvinyl alcohol dehydrogenase (cytochrome)
MIWQTFTASSVGFSSLTAGTCHRNGLRDPLKRKPSTNSSSFLHNEKRRRKHMLRKWTQQSIQLIATLGLLMPMSAAILAPAGVSASIMPARSLPLHPSLSVSDPWTTYLADPNHDNFNSHETLINPTSAPNLKQKWAHPADNGISDQPIESAGVVYWGSWDGYLHATNVSTNARIWTTFIGQTSDSSCDPPSVGVASSPALANLDSQLVIFVGGGDASLYALDAATGKILWRTALGETPSTFIWDSPTIFGSNVYIGTSSFGDCPLVQSKFFQLDIFSGRILTTFPIVPKGCTGGGVWGSPTLDVVTGNIFISTGNSGSCKRSETNAYALLELNAATLRLVNRHQLPPGERPGDSDFGSTPTLFTATMGGVTRSLVGVANKNGKFYAFARSNISAKVVWTARIADTGDCPQCGTGSISPAAWDGSWLYIAGGRTVIDGSRCKGSVRKVDPATGKFIWSHCATAGPVLGSVTIIAAQAGPATLVAVSQGNTVIVMDASTGSALARLSDGKPGSQLCDGPTIADGVLLVGNLDGNLYAYAIDGA